VREKSEGKSVEMVHYTAYKNLALKTMLNITKNLSSKHGLKGIAIAHRLGAVPIGEESILVAVSAPHHHAAWAALEEALEECRRKVEIWRWEKFDGEEGTWGTNEDEMVGKNHSS
jgi:molybdopterin synthase catalytic subunit